MQPSFSPSQVKQLIEIAEVNNQLGWIIGDDDVQAFYSSLSHDQLDQATLERLSKLVATSKPEPG